MLSRIFRTFAFSLLITLIAISIPSAHGQTFSVIHNFTAGGDGLNPLAGLTLDRAGNFYGTASGGAGGYGMIFSLKRAGSGWILNPLYSFTDVNDGYVPWGELTMDRNGILYGETYEGGIGTCYGGGCGTVFSLKPPAAACPAVSCPWTHAVLYRFTGGGDGGLPLGTVILDQAGNLYGTTYHGGMDNGGVVYQLVPSNGGWSQNILRTFASGNGGQPQAGLVLDSAGSLYGTTSEGGDHDKGTVFRLASSGSDWTLSVVYSIGAQIGDDGTTPLQGVIVDPSGNLYGTTGFNELGGGTAFELSPSSGGWTYTLLNDFAGSGTQGPTGGYLVMDRAGNLYGTNYSGGVFGFGSVFKLTHTNGGWTSTVLHSFTGGIDGGAPMGSVVLDASGNLYGAANLGGGVPELRLKRLRRHLGDCPVKEGNWERPLRLLA